MKNEIKNQVINFTGILILLLLAFSIYRLSIYLDISNFKRFLSTSGSLIFVWYASAFFLYAVIAGGSKETETKNYIINNKNYSVTKETGKIIGGDEEGGKYLFKIWWLLFPIYFAFWREIKIIYFYNFTEHKNLNLIIKVIIFLGSLVASVYSIIALNKQRLPNKILQYLMYGVLILYGIFLIIGFVIWAMK
jgi:hypothetical protein